MKQKHILIMAVTAVAFAQSALATAALPEFKSREEVRAIRAEQADQSKKIVRGERPRQGVSSFYTGKTADSDTGDFLFLFRNYDSELARWKSADPSGFPDGLNNQFYAPNPVCEIDISGLLKLSMAQNTGNTIVASHGGNSITFEVWTCNTDDDQFTINLYKYVSGGPVGTDYTFNCHGYSFGNSQYWIDSPDVSNILNGDGYTEITGSDKSAAKVAVWSGNGGHTALVTATQGQQVSQVTGKAGAVPGLNTTSPSAQWSGTPKYYE